MRLVNLMILWVHSVKDEAGADWCLFLGDAYFVTYALFARKDVLVTATPMDPNIEPRPWTKCEHVHLPFLRSEDKPERNTKKLFRFRRSWCVRRARSLRGLALATAAILWCPVSCILHPRHRRFIKTDEQATCSY